MCTFPDFLEFLFSQYAAPLGTKLFREKFLSDLKMFEFAFSKVSEKDIFSQTKTLGLLFLKKSYAKNDV